MKFCKNETLERLIKLTINVSRWILLWVILGRVYRTSSIDELFISWFRDVCCDLSTRCNWEKIRAGQ